MARRIRPSVPVAQEQVVAPVEIQKAPDVKGQALAIKGMAQDVDAYVPDKLANVLFKALESIDDADFRNAELKDKAFFIDRMFDKLRLATGRSTSQVDVVHMLSRLTGELNPSAPLEEVKEITVEVSDGNTPGK